MILSDDSVQSRGVVVGVDEGGGVMEIKRMSYSEVYDVIALYAHEMLKYFADGWSRFPQGGNAAMIVNYLNDKAQFYYDVNENVAKKLAAAGGEIIAREK